MDVNPPSSSSKVQVSVTAHPGDEGIVNGNQDTPEDGPRLDLGICGENSQNTLPHDISVHIQPIDTWQESQPQLAMAAATAARGAGGSRSVFSIWEQGAGDDEYAVLDGSHHPPTPVRGDKRASKGSKGFRSVAFWGESTEEEPMNQEKTISGSSNIMTPERSYVGATPSWGMRRGQRHRKDSETSGHSSRSDAVVASAYSIAQSDGGISIMEGVMGKMKMLDMANDGSTPLEPYASQQTNMTTNGGGGHFWKSRFFESEPAVEEDVQRSCSLPLFSYIAAFALCLAAVFSTAAILLIEELIRQTNSEGTDVAEDIRAKTYTVFVALTVLSPILGGLVGLALARPFRRVLRRMLSIGFQGSQAMQTQREAFDDAITDSVVADVQHLEHALERLQSNIATFECFLPETVVHGILEGDVKAQRLHVEKREVSIMFSDVKDFTNISESLKPKDTLLLLTRYLDIMSRIAQSFEGVVAEILGDGLLVYWNTPDVVMDHGVKAATTALAQQKALKPLNAELETMKLPRIAIRVGLHTGTVLTGNIGSLNKMKFGCMGDAVNLAARLESLCKLYKASVVCSGELHQSLDPGVFFCRRLDVVRVKGKTKPTTLFEIIGVEQTSALDAAVNSRGLRADDQTAMVNVAVTRAFAASTKVMQTVHGYHWMQNMKGAANTIMRSRTNLSEDATIQTTGTTRSHHLVAQSTSQELGDDNSPGKKSAVRRRGSFTEIMREPLLLSLAESVTEEARHRAGIYEDALHLFQMGNFVEAKTTLEGLLESEEAREDGACQLLMKRAKQYLAEDGQTCLLDKKELDAWDGIHNLDEK